MLSFANNSNYRRPQVGRALLSFEFCRSRSPVTRVTAERERPKLEFLTTQGEGCVLPFAGNCWLPPTQGGGHP